MTNRLLTILTIGVLCFIAGMIFWLVATGRGNSTPPRGAERFEVRGIDVSVHNGMVNFNAVADAGYQFAMIKSTEGSTHKDRNFIRNVNAARRAGLHVGAYHFFRFDTPGYMQALNMLNSVRGMPLDMPLAVDIEEWTNPDDRSPDAVVAEIDAMVSKLRDEGWQVMLYTNKDGYEKFIRGRLERYPVWICSLTDIDNDFRQILWQHSHSGIINGVDRMTDLNVFTGTPEQWDSLLIAPAPQYLISRRVN